ncbi:MAG: enoyl-CoA hydratase-related protein [Bacteroidia bacterium]|nr:enoyl-CoA hydratase-related protein [Bacteroidia bacterium]MDW8333989.1 enoyl-CoA hydratase-related protein [Bacteroidia bacterium]
MKYYDAGVLRDFADRKFGYLKISHTDKILTLTLNRPEKKNAMNPKMMNELAYAMAYAHHNSDVWAVVLRAEGDVFCAGADLKAFAGADDETVSDIPDPGSEVLLGELFLTVHKPCVARVHAPVYAGGFLLVCGCHYVVASERATFTLPEVRRGVFPMQVMASLLQILPPRKALDLCLRAQTLDARAALEIGLATHVCNAENLDAGVQSILNELMEASPNAVRLGLQAYDRLRSIPADEAHAFLKGMLAQTIASEDFKEGLAAFKEKRKPVWKGR